MIQCAFCGSDEMTPIGSEKFRCQFCQKITPMKPVQVPGPSQPPVTPLDFDELFSRVMRLKGEAGDGTGFIIGPKGHVITNAHVVQDSPILEGIRGNYPALLELEPISNGTVMGLDLALLSFVEPADFPRLEWANALPAVGEEVFVLGNPKNLGLSVTRATVSQIKDAEIQLNTTLNPGNSGGPVINQDGEVVGVVSYQMQDVQGMAFAIHVHTIQRFVQATFEGRNETYV